MLAGTDWTNVHNLAANIEDTRMDALGTVAWQRSAVQDQQNHPEHVYEYEPGTSRVSRIRFKVPEYRGDYVDTLSLANDTTARGYDASGNAVSGWKRGWRTDYRKEESRSYYSADDRLAAVRSYVEIQPTPFMLNRRGSLVEYRYDALGRRVLVRTTRDGVCVTNSPDVDCTSGIERFVYAGDNVLWEMRGPGSASSSPAELDQAIGTGQEYGAIGYTHAGGVDRPLAAYKLGVNAAVIAPHTNWRGEFSGGTYLLGSQSTAPVSWPGYSTTAWYQGKPPQEQNRVYMGTVLEGQRDASGQIYKRNRMYDPQTGQFTQTDPIGIAGGLNTYGFAEGDPVTHSDPYGLCPQCVACAAGAISDVAIGYGVSRAMGTGYRGRDAITGLVAGCAGGLIGQFAAARHLRHLRHARHIDEGAEAARIAGVASRARNPLLQVESAAREVGELGLGQGQAMEVLKQSITRMGLEYGDDVSIDGVRYLTAQVTSRDGTVRAVSVAADGKVANATLREVRSGVYEVVR